MQKKIVENCEYTFIYLCALFIHLISIKNLTAI